MSSSSSDASAPTVSRRAGLLGRVWGAITGRNAAEAEAKRISAIWGIGPNGVQIRDPSERLAVPPPPPDPPAPVVREVSAKIAELRLVLEVPFADKEQAKALGARWDKVARVWYAPAGIDHAPFEAWLPGRVQPVDPVAQFADALRRAGLRPKGPIKMDGQRHYTEIEGSRSKRGFYVAHLDGIPSGTIINHKTGERVDWKVSGQERPISAQERERMAVVAAQKSRERTEERERMYERTADQVGAMWAAAIPVSTHSYLETKGVEPHGLRQGALGQTVTLDDREGRPREVSVAGQLFVPVRDVAGALSSLQFIRQDGSKMFMPNGRVDRGGFAIGDVHQPGPLLIAEGFSTAATVHELTGHPVVAAFNAGNLGKVAQAYRERFPGRAIYIAGDNDHCREAEGKPNVGRQKAEEAAAAVGGQALIPSFSPGAEGSDWNDVARIEGREAAQLALVAAIRIAEREQMVVSTGTARLSEHSLGREPAKGRQREGAELER